MDQNRSYADAVRGQRDPAQRIREQVCAKTLACMMTADRQSSDDRNGNCIGRVAPHFAGRSRALNRACRDAEIADDLVVFAHNISAREPAFVFQGPMTQPVQTEARSVGEGCVSTCRSWWSPFH